jgi:hypothetical protein
MANLVAMGAAIGAVIFLLADAVFAQLSAPAPTPTTTPIAPLAGTSAAAPSPTYRTCAQARAAGAAPLYANAPGYAPHLDADRDGIACEPYAGAP